MNKALAELIKISNITGKDPTLVQGGGGNTSAKTPDGKYMYIKASGTALKDMTAKKGWRRLRLSPVLTIINNKSIAKLDTFTRETEIVNRLLLACDDDFSSDARPSVESHLHAFLDNYVIHLHPNAVGAYVNAKNGRPLLERLFADQKLPPLWVPYTDPGFTLAKKIAGLISDYKNHHGKKPAILFLEKHGLFVSAADPQKALRIVRAVIKRCRTKLKYPKPVKSKPLDKKLINETKLSIRQAFFTATGQHTSVTCYSNGDILAFSRQRNAKKMLAAPPLAPDEVIYSNGPAMWLETPNPKKITAKLTSQINRGTSPSIAFLVKGIGLFVAAPTKLAPTVKDIALSSLFIRANALRFGGIHALTKRQQEFISQWESEAFRKTLATGAAAGQLKDRIAVVTGAGSGLGRSIAIGLARAGATVALADIDKKAAQNTRALIAGELPDTATIILHCDVTRESSVSAAFSTILDNFGGLDILVNAAGLAPPYSLVDLPADKWRQALEVNLTGYFLMAKHAAKILIAQAIGGSIINISSKSGLQASKNNTPYNATKAGEIHMARGWALELGPHAIRVNSVCPGNVFEGSKIWNPQYIKTCAKKYGIKPEEVIPYYVSKTALNRQIKGADVADSVIFLCSESAKKITGQTLVTDAGQVMVR